MGLVMVSVTPRKCHTTRDPATRHAMALTCCFLIAPKRAAQDNELT